MAALYVAITLYVGLCAAAVTVTRFSESWLVVQVATSFGIAGLLYWYNLRSARASRPSWRTPLASEWHRGAAHNDAVASGE